MGVQHTARQARAAKTGEEEYPASVLSPSGYPEGFTHARTRPHPHLNVSTFLKVAVPAQPHTSISYTVTLE